MYLAIQVHGATEQMIKEKFEKMAQEKQVSLDWATFQSDKLKGKYKIKITNGKVC